MCPAGVMVQAHIFLTNDNRKVSFVALGCSSDPMSPAASLSRIRRVRDSPKASAAGRRCPVGQAATD